MFSCTGLDVCGAGSGGAGGCVSRFPSSGMGSDGVGAVVGAGLSRENLGAGGGSSISSDASLVSGRGSDGDATAALEGDGVGNGFGTSVRAFEGARVGASAIPGSTDGGF